MATPCHSFSFVVTLCHSLSFVVPLVVTRCHSLSLAVIRCCSLYHSLSLDVPLACLLINDQKMKNCKPNHILDRSSHRNCSKRKGVLSNFAKFTEKHKCQRLCFKSYQSLVCRPAGLRSAALIKRESGTGVFR